MGIKFNWGTGIVLVILIFFGTIAIRIFISYQHEISLVDEDYYTKEISYQEHIDKEANTNKLSVKPIFSINDNELKLQFPAYFKNSKLEGSIHFYRPSDKYLDHHFKLDLDDSLSQTMIISDLKKGGYELKLDWVSDSTAYFLKQEITIN